ncbi:Z1 domain-containing protein [Leptospira alexanderi]|uniref:Z1 domain-containing protein n=1 Tax=Leptospira alexanderi TaxID=100053 RepID=UPI000990B1C3|nr:Z1 domain-containing protein [Leptospira alexanderi]
MNDKDDIMETPSGARIVKNSQSEVILNVDGFIVNQVKKVLGLDEKVFNNVKVQAINFLGQVVKYYETDIAKNEVGANGRRVASTLPPLSGKCPVGLLYGRIQSGKTLGMIISTALAIDNGFRIVVLFTSNSVKLVDQTYRRFDIGAKGLIVRSSADRKNSTKWEGDIEHIKSTLKNDSNYGLVLICQKESKHLDDVKSFLDKINAPSFPVLLLDDEADQATPDTNTRKRANSDQDVAPSKTFSQIVWTEEEESILQLLPHHIFVQVTATPFALLLQNIDSELKPRFCQLLEPGEDYTGGEEFFEDWHIAEEGSPPLVFVDGTELEEQDGHLPDGLSRAVHYFLVSSIIQEMNSNGSAPKVKNFLCHTSFKKDEHTALGNVIKRIVEQISNDINASKLNDQSLTIIRLSEAIEELSKTYSKEKIPSLNDIISELRMIIPLRQILVINSNVDSDLPERGLNFLIGGNILGRGLTIENLLVTYYMRQPRISQMDTMLQHARMYGYRRKLLPFLRVYLPEELAIRFNSIHSSERDLRDQIRKKGFEGIPVNVAGNLKSTRISVLDPRNISAYVSGRQFYPHRPEYRKEKVKNNFKKIEEYIGSLYAKPGKFLELSSQTDSNKHFEGISIKDACEIIKMIPVDSNEEFWNSQSIIAALQSLERKYAGRMLLYTRGFGKRSRDSRKNNFLLKTGVTGGDELKRVLEQQYPVLMVFRALVSQEELWDGVNFWYPSFGLPSSSPNIIYNETDYWKTLD